MSIFRIASLPRPVVTISFCIVLTLIPVLCNAGGWAPRHAAEMAAPAHAAGHSPGDHGTPAVRHLAQPMPSCSPYHGHACCLLAARKPLREDAPADDLACASGAASQDAIMATPAGRGSFATPSEAHEPPALAAINVPLLR